MLVRQRTIVERQEGMAMALAGPLNISWFDFFFNLPEQSNS